MSDESEVDKMLKQFKAEEIAIEKICTWDPENERNPESYPCPNRQCDGCIHNVVVSRN